jgi:hypothetical protein
MTTVIGMLLTTTAGFTEVVQVRVDRWLAVQQVVGRVFYLGNVLYKSESGTQPAYAGMRLTSVGEGIQTGDRAKAVLGLDTGVGTIQVAERTDVRIQQLLTTPSGGRITRLRVNQGQIRLKVRQFTNPDSRLEIQTPAGVSGVRGTVFGVSVQPSGRMGVATLVGRAVAAAQGQEVIVEAGFQSLVIPGEPPQPPTRLTENLRLDLDYLVPFRVRQGDRQVRIAGRIDPVNLLVIAGVVQNTDRTGYFDVTVPLPNNRQINAVVTTPLGKEQVYELAVP